MTRLRKSGTQFHCTECGRLMIQLSGTDYFCAVHRDAAANARVKTAKYINWHQKPLNEVLEQKL